MSRSLQPVFLGILVTTAALHAQTAADPRGIYIYTEHLAQDASLLNQALAVPGVDGLTLLLGWTSLEPSQAQYQWATLDQWITTAMQSNKKIALAIRAGQDTPCWLFQAPACGAGSAKQYAGATPLTFSVSPREGVGQSTCTSETIAAPWDPVFLSQWDALLAALAAHLKTAGTYSAITSVRLTGINRTTSELRLPAEILSTPCVTNSVRTWLNAAPPFRAATLLTAWDQLTNSFLKNFPDKLFGVEIIPTASGDSSLEYPFPAIDDAGCAYQPPWPTSPSDPNYSPAPCFHNATVPDQNSALLALASQKFFGRLSVSYQNLDLSQSAQPYVVYAAQTWGTAIGFQTNDYINFQQAACSGGSAKPGPCTSATYLSLLELGIYPLGKTNGLHAEYIEVLPPDAISFPAAIQQAHAELVPPPTLTAGSAANGATYLSGGLVPGSWAQVKGTALANVTHIGWTDSDLAGLGNNLPTDLNGTEVKVNGIPAAVYAVVPTQVDFQVPNGITGNASVQVFNSNVGSNVITAGAASNSPGIFPCVANGTNYPCAYFPDGKFVGDPAAGTIYRKAKAGDVIQLYATGLIPTPAGVRINVTSVNGVNVTLGNITVAADAAVLLYPGEFQINFTVPAQFASLPESNYPLTIAVSGISSPASVVVPTQQ